MIKSSLQSSLPYIPIYMVHANYCAPYPKVPCVRHKVNMWCTCCMMLLLLELSISFHVSHNLWLLLSPDVTCCMTTWSHYSNPNPSSKNRIRKIKIKMRKKKGKTKSTSCDLNTKHFKSLYYKMNYSLICDIWTLGTLSEV